MANFTLTVPDAVVTRARDALCAYIGKTAPADQTLPNAKLGLNQLLKNTIKTYEANKAVSDAAAAAAAVADVDVT